ncbi:MAG: Ig-like domain-containing protein [Gemmatimonadota bacterium]
MSCRSRCPPGGAGRFRRRLPILGLVAGASFLLSGCGDSDTPTTPEANDPPTITLTAPAAGVTYEPGGTLEIKWTASDDKGVTGVDLSYTADGGKSGTIASGQTGSSYTWTLPSEALFGVKVKAVAKDESGLTGEDETDIFAIVHKSERGYVTSSVCKNCHSDYYDELFKSGHPYKLNKVVDGTPPTYPFSTVPNPPQGYTWDDISYVIGGYGWKARFLDKDGYILVTGVTGVNVQYNLPRDDIGLPAGWVAYHSSDTEPKPYTCGTCHTTGWQTTAENGGKFQDGLVGIQGTWEEPGIRCEQCHGPGGDHVAAKDPKKISVDTEKELCGSCHFRDTNHGILASGGFIRHHEQYDELIASGHNALSCTDCHDPHVGTRYGHAEEGGIKVTCESCHSDKTSNAHTVPVECSTCHMPRASKSAQKRDSYFGDLKTHLFKINTGTETKDAMFYTGEGGATFTRNFVTLDFVCYQCHTDPVTGEGGGKSAKTMAELSAKAVGIHN